MASVGALGLSDGSGRAGAEQDRMPTEQTGFGLVDREALERLRDEYDTMQILYAVDRLDQTRNLL